MARQVVVLGTGTGVGKTYTTRALAKALGERLPDAPIQVVKPVESGAAPGASPAPGSDAALLEAVTRGLPPPRPHPLYALPDPISPHLAARRSQTVIALDEIREWRDATLHALSNEGWLFVESAGGVFSPLSDTHDNFDLARTLEPAEWLLVAPDCLGVLHDVSATLGAMRARGRLPDYIVLCAARPADASTGTNAAELERLGIAKVTGCLPKDESASAARALADILLEAPAN